MRILAVMTALGWLMLAITAQAEEDRGVEIRGVDARPGVIWSPGGFPRTRCVRNLRWTIPGLKPSWIRLTTGFTVGICVIGTTPGNFSGSFRVEVRTGNPH